MADSLLWHAASTCVWNDSCKQCGITVPMYIYVSVPLSMPLQVAVSSHVTVDWNAHLMHHINLMQLPGTVVILTCCCKKTVLGKLFKHYNLLWYALSRQTTYFIWEGRVSLWNKSRPHHQEKNLSRRYEYWTGLEERCFVQEWRAFSAASNTTSKNT